MTYARIVHRVSHAAERVRLGLRPPVKPDVPQGSSRAPVTPGVASDDKVVERSTRELAELRAQLERSERERTVLEAAVREHQAQVGQERESARQHGYQEGLAKAQTEAERALAERVGQWQSTLERLTREFESLQQTIRSELTDIALTAVGKLLGEHLVNPQSLRATVEQTLREAGVSGAVRVLMAPGQFEQLMRFGAPQVAALRERRIEIAPDARVAYGGCMLETPAGLVDGRFEAQLARLKEIIAQHYAGGGAAR